MRKLELSRDTWDNENKFKVEGVLGDVSLEKDYKKVGDGILWGLQSGALIKSYYSPEDIKHRERMNNYVPIKNGEIVQIDGKHYKTRVLGNFSDCVMFDLI